KVRELLSKMNSKLAEYLNGMKVIQLFNQERETSKNFNRVNKAYYNANMKQILVYGVFRPSIDLLSSIGIALVLWYGGGEVIRNTITLGMLVAFISYIKMFFNPIQDISERFNIAEDAMAASERVFTLLDTKEEERNTGTIKNVKLNGKIEFKNVWHRYKEEWVLKDVSFIVNPKESIAIVGPTGAGKTSIISLITRFYESEKGEILIDDLPLSEYDLNFLRQNTGIVMQDVFLFAGSIKDNIRLHNSKINDNDIRQVSEYVNANKFINNLPKTYDTNVKERGVRFSMGERQLLSFARALAVDPIFLILDEATSSVDSETESLIQDAITKLLEERTSIVIAHRLSTIKTVDRILVIDKGKIVEEGKHSDLIKKKGMYYALYKLQYLK
ncbi:ABC transporter ATP-binding protein, partial [candidate division WOR-3 bacterium]|nr:ABC transporter ATP-binding protein [candidate division WOR-3 bacterium]